MKERANRCSKSFQTRGRCHAFVGPYVTGRNIFSVSPGDTSVKVFSSENPVISKVPRVAGQNIDLRASNASRNSAILIF